MKTTWSNGRHSYRGKLNSRSQRKSSKIYKGISINYQELEKALIRIKQDYGFHASSKTV